MGRCCGGNGLASLIGDNDVLAAVGALTYQNFYGTGNGGDDFQVRTSVIAVELAADGGYSRCVVSSHADGLAVLNSHTEVDSSVLSGHFLGSQQCAVLIVHDGCEALELSRSNILLDSHERAVVHTGDSQRSGITIVNNLCHIAAVVLPTSGGRRSGSNCFTFAVGYNNGLAAIGALAY